MAHRRRGGQTPSPPAPPPTTPAVTAAQTAAATAAPELAEDVREGSVNNRAAIFIVLVVLGIVAAVSLIYTAWPAPTDLAAAAKPAVPLCDTGAPTLILPYPGPNGARHDVKTESACMTRLYRIPDGVEWSVEHGGIIHLETWSGRQRISQDAPGDVWHGNIDNLAFRMWGGGPATIVLRRKAPVAESVAQSSFPASPRTVRSTTIDVEPVCATAHTFRIPVPESPSEKSMVYPVIMEDPACWTGVIITPPEFAKGFALAEIETTIEVALPDGHRFPVAPNGTWEFRGQQAFRVKGQGKFLVALQDRVSGGASSASTVIRAARSSDPENERMRSIVRSLVRNP